MQRQYVTQDNTWYPVSENKIKMMVSGQQFSARKGNDGFSSVYSIHPYDETEYHWAKQVADHTWRIFRAGQLIDVYFTKSKSLFEIAEILLKMDRDKGLKRTGGIW